jgi:limonene-1,2-epoxide hydrolase
MSEETVKTYSVQITEEIKATSPIEALRAFLYRLENEETEASVEHVESGTTYLIECQTGEMV